MDKYSDIPPYHHLVNHAPPKTSYGAAKLLAKAIDSIIIEKAPQLLVHDLLLVGGWLLVVLNAPQPEAEDDHEIETAERMLNAPVGGRCARNPSDALESGDLDAIETGLNDIEHLLAALDLVASVCHSGSNFV